MSSDVDPASGSASEKPGASSWDWADRGTPHVLFDHNEPLPFQEGEILGHGVNGPVIQTVIKGVRVAVKRIYCRQRVGPKDLQEIGIIRKLKHPHIIQLAGSYTRGRYLGILLYPVARCDLATFLEDVDFLRRLAKSPPLVELSECEERKSRCATISRIRLDQLDHTDTLSALINAARARLWGSYGCITSAMMYLHSNSIRHKDLKPLNILLSHDGLWITDFGHSTDFSEFSSSATGGGERGTIKYCAPEVAEFERSGRSADVFSLGCIFFEMAALSCYTLEEMKNFRLSKDRSFHNNLHNILPVFDDFGSTPLGHLPMSLVRRMLSKDPVDRPDLASISSVLNLYQAFSAIEPKTFASIRCPYHHHTFLPLGNFPDERMLVEEVLITVGNTCHEQIADRARTSVVVFVECSSVDYIESVIFFQHSSSKDLSVTFSEPPFARCSTPWGIYTQAILLILKPGYYWRSTRASLIQLGANGSYQSVLPMAWELQLGGIYASHKTRVPIYHM